MRALVIGYGSIGARHTRLLSERGDEVAVVSRRNIDHTPTYRSIDEAVHGFQPDCVVIASRTAEHRSDMDALHMAGFRGRLLIEKPMYDTGSNLPPAGFEAVKVAYNLRFHPALQRFRDCLAGHRVFAVNVYTGSYLPGWRPESDYRTRYSARRAEGGGVLRDLSHELDYTLWLFGAWQRVTAIGGRFGNLEIDSDDVFSILIETDIVPSVTLGINYLDSKTRREILALTDNGTVRLDLVRGAVETPQGAETFETGRDDTYRAQLNAFAMSDDTHICDMTEGLQVMRLIDASERAASSGAWVHQ